MGMEEQQAVRLLKDGDLKGLDHLVQLYYFRAVKTAYLIVQDRDEAEDIVQNAFMHACEKIDQLASNRFGPWFLRSVVNTSIKVARKLAKQVSLNAETGDETLTLEDVLVDRQPSPETQVEMGELTQQVWQALRQLSADQRAAVVLKYYLDLSEVEMTAELKRPVSTIKWRLYAARERLKDLLRPHIFPPHTNPQPSASPSDEQE
jgi:RNA polymerase sigma-70 factor (ECF subfamily)